MENLKKKKSLEKKIKLIEKDILKYNTQGNETMLKYSINEKSKLEQEKGEIIQEEKVKEEERIKEEKVKEEERRLWSQTIGSLILPFESIHEVPHIRKLPIAS